jgi:hypothetical protein
MLISGEECRPDRIGLGIDSSAHIVSTAIPICLLDLGPNLQCANAAKLGRGINQTRAFRMVLTLRPG